MTRIKTFFGIMVVIIFTSSSLWAVSSPRERSFNVFAKGVDDLLLETPNIFVKLQDKVKFFYIQDLGVFFTGEISITQASNISVVVEEWSKWFGGDKEQTKEESDSNKEKSVKFEKYKSLVEKDHERIAAMEESLKKFKQEIIITMQDFGPILNDLKNDEHVTIVFQVKDKEFAEKYKASYLTVTTLFGKLKSISGKSPDDPNVIKSFKFNI